MKRTVYIDERELCLHSFCDNKVSNTKYTLLNFLPKNLWEQFRSKQNEKSLPSLCVA
jgi:phospholipid-translocating ATPase